MNGAVAATVVLESSASGGMLTWQERRVRFAIPPREQSWVVAIATGDKVTAPFWSMSLPEALAITNPVFVRR